MLRIAGIQFIGHADRAANVASAERLVRDAAARGAKIACLPELFSTMYFCVETKPEYFEWAESVPGPTTERMGSLARELGIVVIAPVFERAPDGRYFNAAAVLGPDGRCLGKYRKSSIPFMDASQSVEPRGNEKYYFTPGDLGFRCFDTRYARIAPLVCWDQWYPEGARLAALGGAQILFYPTAIGFHESDASEAVHQHNAWETIQRSHAIANGVFVASVNRRRPLYR